MLTIGYGNRRKSLLNLNKITNILSPCSQITAINDPALDVDYISYLIKYDSTHGKLPGNLSHTDDEIKVNGKTY